jgi:ribosome-associated protein
LTAKQQAREIAELALTKKAGDVTILDLRKIATMTDFFVVCSGDSDTQVKAIADAVIEGMEERGVRTWHSEGYAALNWVLLDYVDVVVHVFHRDTRNYYHLERLWGDAVFEYVGDKPAVTQRGKTTQKRKQESTGKTKDASG